MVNSKYYIGLDIGTSSCGFCATDEDYNVLSVKNYKNQNHDLWGVRLFDEAQDAKGRRVKRTSRRLVQRRKERILLLQDLFKDEILKIDKDFFIRLKLSSLWEDDKEKFGIFSKNSLFFDSDYKDKDFYEKYPTIYHLRSKLLEKPASDIRLLYLVIHNMLKHRGNFLVESIEESESKSLYNIFCEMQSIIENDENLGILSFGLSQDVENKILELENSLAKGDLKLKDFKDNLIKLLKTKNLNQKGLISAICGGKVNAKTIFCCKDNGYEIESDIDNFGVDDETYLSFLNEVEDLSDNAGEIIALAKQAYTKILYKKILGNNKYFSCALVDRYEKHRNQLKMFKTIIREYYPEHYKNMFDKRCIVVREKAEGKKKETIKVKNNYAAYILGVNDFLDVNSKSMSNKVTRSDFYKYVKSVLDTKPELKDNESVKKIYEEMENDNFLLKLRISENSVIPYQINRNELVKILDNSSKAYPFLLDVDEDGISVKDKIISILEYKIPYFVGPLSTKNSKNAWIVKRSDEKILPWNIEKIVDYERCEKEFINRMQNNCSYIKNEKVLPKNSLLYSEYMLLQDLNNMKINGDKLSSDTKQKLLQKYKECGKLTKAKIIAFLKNETNDFKSDDTIKISGVADDFKTNLNMYKQFNEILNGEIELNIDMVESIIERATLVSDKNRLTKWIKSNYGNKLSDEQIKKIKGLKIDGWGRLSRKFLAEYPIIDFRTGEKKTIIQIMRDETLSLMEIIYHFELEKEFIGKKEKDKITYDDVANLYCSPSVKRGVWQSIRIINEIEKITDKKPEKIFVEVTRHDEEKGVTKDARKKKISELYKKIAKSVCDDIDDLQKELESKDNLNSERLYLYFTQLGKCAYTGERIILDELNSNLYDVDHIIPQSKIKDDSFDNKVLVKRQANEEKGDGLVKDNVILKQKAFWSMLCEKGLFTSEKYNRLIRTKEFTDDDLRGFVERQLVFTNQSAKAVIDLLKSIYGEECIVYSKAKHVSSFRNCEFRFDREKKFEDFDFAERLSQALVKCRNLNNLHHAKDAYLNIVVGNVLDEKYTKKLALYNKDKSKVEGKYSYNILNAFIKDEPNIFEKDKHIPIIIKTLESNTPTVTFLPRTVKGQFYKETIWGVDKHQRDFKDLDEIKETFKDYDSPFFDMSAIPLKSSKNLLNNAKKYGNFRDATYSYFTLVEYTEIKKKKEVKVRELVAIPFMFAKDIKNKDELKLVVQKLLNNEDLTIVKDKIMVGSILKIGKGYFKIAGKSGDMLKLHNFNELFLPVYVSKYVKLLSKYYEVKNKEELKVENERIMIKTNRFSKKTYLNKEENFVIFNLLISHLCKPIYLDVSLGDIGKKLKEKKDLFKDLSIIEQLEVIKGLFDIINGCNGGDLRGVGESKYAGVLYLGKKISDKKISLISTSITGFYEKEELISNGI